MRRLLTIAALGLALVMGGCSTWERVTGVYTAVQSAEVDPKLAIAVAQSFDLLEVTATNYLILCRDNPANPVCNRDVIRKQIIPTVRAGRAARNNLVTFVRLNPGKLGPAGTYNALVAAVNTLKDVFAQYGIGQVR